MFISQYNIKEHKSHVINIGFDEYFTNNKKINSYAIDPRLNSNSKYILCVSHLYPYKNIVRLLIAYKHVLDATKTSAKLLIAGRGGYSFYDNKIENCIHDLNIHNNVVLLGDVKREDLKELYMNAHLLAFPSPFENFPYTLIEAMSCGTPIVCSNTTAMPEACKNAAIYFDPYDTHDMATKIAMVLKDNSLRQKMSENSKIRANELPNFNKVTFETLNIMKELINN